MGVFILFVKAIRHSVFPDFLSIIYFSVLENTWTFSCQSPDLNTLLYAFSVQSNVRRWFPGLSRWFQDFPGNHLESSENYRNLPMTFPGS